MVEGDSLTPGADDLRYYHADRLGNVAALTDGNGRVTDRYAYDPFGNEIIGSSTSGNPFRYTGRRYDPETGLYFYRARYYDAPLGRFLQTDPIGYADQWNLYTYVGNNPLNATDPSGAQSEEGFFRNFFNFASGNRANNAEISRRAANVPATPGEALFQKMESAMRQEERALTIAANETVIGLENAANGAANAAILVATNAPPVRAARGLSGAAALCCFVAGTEVLTDQGLRPIEDIAVGNLVMARDEVTGKEAFQPVTELTRRNDKIIWEVSAADANGVAETFQTTGDHPWWVEGEGWVRTHALVPGSKLSTLSGLEVTLLSVENTREVQPTYNFEVDGFASYFVGKSQIWVHNGPCKKLDALFAGLQGINRGEFDRLASKWAPGTFETAADSILAHANKHAGGDVVTFLRQAGNFTTRGARRTSASGPTQGTRFAKNGLVQERDANGLILNFFRETPR